MDLNWMSRSGKLIEENMNYAQRRTYQRKKLRKITEKQTQKQAHLVITSAGYETKETRWTTR
jgi:hypothetical protein